MVDNRGRPPDPIRLANMAAHAEAILIEVSREFNIDVKSLRSNSRWGHFMPPRREYARRCEEAGIGCTVSGPVMGRHHTSIREYVCEKRQAYKQAIYRRRVSRVDPDLCTQLVQATGESTSACE